MYNVVIDAGHGGKDPGAVGNNLKEKDINLNVALLLKKKLEPYKEKINLKLTRENDSFLELSERVKISNNFNTNLFISIHCNSSSNSTAKGIETYCYKLSNKKGADAIHSEIIDKKIYSKDRGVKEASYYVLKNTKAHALLIELAFISNTEDAKILKEKQNDFAEAILRGILKYFNIKYQEQNTNAPESNSGSTNKLYRVCLGTFANINNANKLKDELINKGYKDAFIVEK